VGLAALLTATRSVEVVDQPAERREVAPVRNAVPTFNHGGSCWAAALGARH